MEKKPERKEEEGDWDWEDWGTGQKGSEEEDIWNCSQNGWEWLAEAGNFKKN